MKKMTKEDFSSSRLDVAQTEYAEWSGFST